MSDKEKDTVDAIQVILHLYYVEGDMNSTEALDEICHLVFLNRVRLRGHLSNGFIHFSCDNWHGYIDLLWTLFDRSRY